MCCGTSGVKIIQEVGGITSSNDAITKISSALSANAGKVNGMITTGDISTAGLCNVLSDYYKQSPNAAKIKAVGIDTDPITLQAIKDGIIDGTIAQNPKAQVYLSLSILKDLAQGYKVKSGQYFIDSGTAFITKENLSTYQTALDTITTSLENNLTSKYLTK